MLELRFFIKNISDQILIYLISCCDEYISPTLKFVGRILFISSCSGGKRTKVPILLKRDVRSISNYKYFFFEIDLFRSLKFSKIYTRNWMYIFEPKDLFFRTFHYFCPRIGLFFHVQTWKINYFLSCSR